MAKMKWFTVFVAVALMSATVAPSVRPLEAAQASRVPVPASTEAIQASGLDSLDSYALREAQAEGLEQFMGGFHELLGVIVFLVVLVWVLDLLSGPSHGHHGHPSHPHPVHPVHP